MYYNNFNPKPIPLSAYNDGSYVNYKLGNYTPAIKVLSNGVWETLPMHKDGLKYTLTSLVNAGRNLQGTTIGEKIGRDQNKIDGFVIPMLYAHEWSRVLSLLPMNKNVMFMFYDVEKNAVIQRSLYVGDRTATIFSYSQNTIGNEQVLRPEIFTNCAVNFIDRGIQ